jgi:hypothetical protein
MPSCDERADTVDYDTGMWLCESHLDQWADIDAQLAVELARAIKDGSFTSDSEPITVHANMEVER